MQMSFTVTSPTFEYGEPLPLRFTAEGRGEPPSFSWTHAPAGTRSFVFIMEDLDAGGDTPATLWLVYDIPAEERTLDPASPNGVAGRNDLHHLGYGKPSLRTHEGTHRYFFNVYALDCETLGLPSGATRREVEAAMTGHVLAHADIMARYDR